MDIEGKILELIRDQSLIQQQFVTLQTEIDKLQRQQTHKAGQLEAYLDFYKEQFGESLQDAMNTNVTLREKIAKAQEDGRRIALGNPRPIPGPIQDIWTEDTKTQDIPQTGTQEGPVSALEQGNPTLGITQSANAVSKQSLRKVTGNKAVTMPDPTDAQAKLQVLRSKQPVEIAIEDEPDSQQPGDDNE